MNIIKSDASGSFDKGKPIVFTMNDDENEQVEMITQFMTENSPQRNVSEVDVFPLKRLFFALKKRLAAMGKCQELPRESIVDMFFESDPYELNSGISCDVRNYDSKMFMIFV